MKVLISGAGIAGLALAGFLKDTGIEITIVEKSPELPTSGFSIGLWSNGRAMLKKLGISERLDEVGVPLKRLIVRDGKGRIMRDYRLSDFDVEFGSALLDVSRAKLLEWIYEAAGRPQVKYNCTIQRIQEFAHSVHVGLSDGSEGSYDLVVGADGVRSKVRTLTFGVPESYTDWRAWWIWIDASLGEAQTITEYVEPGSFVVMFNEGTRTLAVLMARSNHVLWDDEAGRVERLKEIFKRESYIVPHIFEGKVAKDIMPSDLMEIHMKRWHTERVVLVGDAAHAFVPLAGLGGSMALEDTWILAEELLKHKRDIPLALDLYEAKRKPRVARARRLTAKMRAWGFVRSPFLRWVANIVVSRLPDKLIIRDYVALMREEL